MVSERKAATKELKRLLRKESEISKSSSPTKDEDLKRLAPLIHTARVNLNYTIYHPLNEKYISLYPTEKKKEKKEKKQKSQTDNNNHGEDSASDSESHRSRSRSESQQPRDGDDISNLLICDDSPEKPPMWYVVEKCMADNTLDLLREGKLDTGLGGGGEKTDSSSASANRKDTTAAKSKSAKDKQSGRDKEKDRKKEKEKQKQNYSSSSKLDKNMKGGRKGKEEDVEMRDAEDDDDESDGGFFE